MNYDNILKEKNNLTIKVESMKEAASKYGSVVNELSDAQSKLKSCNDTINTLKIEISRLLTQNTSQSDQIKELKKNQNNEKEKQLLEENEDLKFKITQINNKYINIKNEYTKQINEIEKLKESKNNIDKVEFQQLKETYSNQNSQIEILTSLNDKLKNENQELINNNLKNENIIQELTETNNKLNNIISEQNSNIEQYKKIITTIQDHETDFNVYIFISLVNG